MPFPFLLVYANRSSMDSRCSKPACIAVNFVLTDNTTTIEEAKVKENPATMTVNE